MSRLEKITLPDGWGRAVPGADIRHLRAWRSLRAWGFELEAVRLSGGWGVGCRRGGWVVVPDAGGWVVSAPGRVRGDVCAREIAATCVELGFC